MIVGVAGRDFTGYSVFGTDLWIPVAMAGVARGESGPVLLADPRSTWLVAIGRLQPGQTRSAAEAELEVLAGNFASVTPEAPPEDGVVVAESGRLPAPVRARFRPFLGLLLALAVGLLTIACSNLAGMQLARATVRRRELATRLALGASRPRLVRSLLVEPLLISLAASLMALPIAYWLLGGFRALLPALNAPVLLDFAISGRAMGFAAAIALVASVLVGLAPARRALRPDLSSMLHGRASTDGRARLRVRHGLVVGQLALSIVLVTTAGLFARALQAAATIDPGFDAATVEVASFDTTVAGVPISRVPAVFDDLLGEVRAGPGVESASYARMIPLASGSLALGAIRLDASSAEDSAAFSREAHWDVVSPHYFQTLRLPLVAGRPFTPADREGQAPVAIVNETFARRAWPGASAVGRHFWQLAGQGGEASPRDRLLEVVGVARDAKYQAIDEPPQPFVYVPFAQQPQTHVEVFVRHPPAREVVADVRTAAFRVAPDLPIVSARPLDDAVAGGLFPQRLAAWTSGLVGLVGVSLAGLVCTVW